MTKEELETRCNELFLQTCEQAEKIKELEETLKTYNGCGDWDNDFHTCRVYLQHEELQMYVEQLTKAKEIIKQFLNDYPIITKDLLDKLEQFISEMEK